MKISVTGATAFIGFVLVEYLGNPPDCTVVGLICVCQRNKSSYC